MKRFFLYFIVIITFSCSKKIDIEGFNEEAWQHDKNGCEGIRENMTTTLSDIKSQLLTLDTDAIISILGRPNKAILSTRNQKKFVYTISPSEKCDNYSSEKSTQLYIRFNAVGRAYEIIIN